MAAATDLFALQQYDKVILLLQPVLPQVTKGQLISEAFERYKFFEMLGVSLWYQEQRDAARRVFTELLKANAVYRLSTVQYPEELIRFFENHKADLISYGVIGAGGSTQQGPRRVKVRETRINTTPTIAYLMPFGIGQFANGEDTKGAIVLTLQLIGVLATVGSYFGHQALICDDKRQCGSVSSGADEATNEALRAVSIGGWALFGGAYVYGLVDGFVSRPPSSTTVERTEVEDPDDAPSPTTLRLGPASRGVGLGLSGSF